MEKFVIFIGGVPNAGKTTISAGLACLIPNTIFIDSDFVLNERQESECKNKLEKWHKQIEVLAKNINLNYCNGYNNVIARQLSKKDFNYLKENLDSEIKLTYIFLNPDIYSLKEMRKISRPLRRWENKRIHEMTKENYHTQTFIDLMIDNSGLTPHETTKIILFKLFQ